MKDNNEHIDSLLKDKLEHLSMPFEEKHWNKVVAQLPKQVPFYKKKRFLFFFSTTFVAALIGLGAFYYNAPKQIESTSGVNQVSTTNASSQSHKNTPSVSNEVSLNKKGLETTKAQALQTKSATDSEQKIVESAILQRNIEPGKIESSNQEKGPSAQRESLAKNNGSLLSSKSNNTITSNSTIKPVQSNTLSYNPIKNKGKNAVGLSTEEGSFYTKESALALTPIGIPPYSPEAARLEERATIWLQEDITSKDVKRQKFEISLSGGWVGISAISKPKKSTYQFGSGWMGEALFGYSANNNISIHTGINLSHTKQNISFKDINIETTVNTKIEDNSFWDVKSNFRLISEYYFHQGVPYIKKVNQEFIDSTFVQKIDTLQITKHDTSLFTENLRHEQLSFTVPVLLGFKKQWRKGELMLLTGPSFTYLLDNKMVLRDSEENASSLIVTQSMAQVLWNYELRIRASYLIKPNLHFILEPGSRINLSNSFNSSSKLSHKSAIINIKTGFMFKF